MKAKSLIRVVAVSLVALCISPSLAFACNCVDIGCGCVTESFEYPGKFCYCPKCPCAVVNSPEGRRAGLTIPRPVLDEIVYSNKYLYKPYINYSSLDASLYSDRKGPKLTFKELLDYFGSSYALTMRTSGVQRSLALGITPKALERLYELRLYTVRVANGRDAKDTNDYVEYDVRDLLALAEEAELAENAELYLTGPDDDVMLRSPKGALTKLGE